MSTSNPGMRGLYEQILRYEGHQVFDEVLVPWVVDTDYYEEYLWQFESEYPTADNDRWEFYALLRVLEILTLQLQPDNKADGASSSPVPPLTAQEYGDFIKLLGLEVSAPTHYHPFNCEILEAVKGERDFHILTHYFPAVGLNGMLLKRAGVIVEVNQSDAALATINTATIYWSHWQKNRAHKDLSQGWGSNSQWRTSPRIDIETATTFIYNSSGEFDLTSDSPETAAELAAAGLTRAQAIELVINRHFITPGNSDKDLYPYEFKYEEVKKPVNPNVL